MHYSDAPHCGSSDSYFRAHNNVIRWVNCICKMRCSLRRRDVNEQMRNSREAALNWFSELRTHIEIILRNCDHEINCSEMSSHCTDDCLFSLLFSQWMWANISYLVIFIAVRSHKNAKARLIKMSSTFSGLLWRIRYPRAIELTQPHRFR